MPYDRPRLERLKAIQSKAQFANKSQHHVDGRYVAGLVDELIETLAADDVTLLEPIRPA